MLTPADDYPLHQTAEPLAVASGERNFYDRFFFNGYSSDGRFFALALGQYPHLGIMDAAFSVLAGGRQHNVRASRHQVPLDRLQTKVGPVSVEIVEPLRVLRLRCEHEAIAAELRFERRCEPVAEPRFLLRAGSRLVFDYTRMTQLGRWYGRVEVDGERWCVDEWWGCRDRSWGFRPIGAPDLQGSPQERQFFWVWAPVNFPRRAVLFFTNEDGDGVPFNRAAAIVPVGEGAPERIEGAAIELELLGGRRRAERARIVLGQGAAAPRMELEGIADFAMSGLGYLHPTWGHGLYHGPLEVAYDTLPAEDAPGTSDAIDPLRLHVQTLCRARYLPAGDEAPEEGLGVLEQLYIGRHEPTGLS